MPNFPLIFCPILPPFLVDVAAPLTNARATFLSLYCRTLIFFLGVISGAHLWLSCNARNFQLGSVCNSLFLCSRAGSYLIYRYFGICVGEMNRTTLKPAETDFHVLGSRLYYWLYLNKQRDSVLLENLRDFFFSWGKTQHM